MTEVSYEALKSALKRPAEVKGHVERRRRWSSEDKLRIVRETLEPGAVVQVIADRHDISTGLLYTWRKQMLAVAMNGFAPVKIVEPAEPTANLLQPEPDRPGSKHEDNRRFDAAVEIELPSGARVRVATSANAALLSGIFTALRAL